MKSIRLRNITYLINMGKYYLMNIWMKRAIAFAVKAIE